MDSFLGKLAVVTGGGSGIGRELVRQLAAQGCSVAACDVNAATIKETAVLAAADAAPGVRLSSHSCDVSDEGQVSRFRNELLAEHGCEHVDVVFSNAGIGGGASFVRSPREEWERTFAVDWWGVYYCARVFLPLLIRSGDGVLVNTSSINGLWATVGPGIPNTAYSAAKFAVRGFTEALIEDLRVNDCPVRVALVLPGQVETGIVANTRRIHGYPDPVGTGDDKLKAVRSELLKLKAEADGAAPAGDGQAQARPQPKSGGKAALSAANAATLILDGVRSGAWRILVGDDVKRVDARVRANPDASYRYRELFSGPLPPAAWTAG